MEGDAEASFGDRPFQCHTCAKKYLRKNNLEDHVLMEHPDTDQAADIVALKAAKGRSKGSLIVQCEICSKRFRYQSDLKNHFESHFRGGRRSGLNGDFTPRSRMVSRYLTRPCIYCGRTFTDHETLARHESAEAIEFEREANKFEGEQRSRVTQSDLEEAPRQSFHQVDRTDEEFGDDDESSLEIDLSYPGRVGPLISPSLYPPPAFTPRLPPTLPDATVPQPSFSAAAPPLVYPQQHNHTSQYSQDYSLANPPSYPTPPPAHEDPTTVHGFLPPPPALPLPEFTQGCHRPASVVAELPDPMEERTFTVLQSKDETVSSCLVSMSPSREVLDLSMPKLELTDHETAKEEDGETVMTNGYNGHNGHMEEVEEVMDFSIPTDRDQIAEEAEEDIDPAAFVQAILSDIIESVLSDTRIILNGDEREQKEEEPSDETDSPVHENGVNGVDLPDADAEKAYVVKVKRVKDETGEDDDESDEELVIFEPNRMPAMPEANIALAEDRRGRGGLFERGLTEEDWAEFGDYAGLMDEDEEEDLFGEDPPVRSTSPVQFEDPNRIDCKHCGMIFNDGHVRKFHEQSHMEIEDVYDDNELTRLFCGFCGKNFKKAQYRIMHEKGHTGELPVTCPNCGRQFRWESELKSHLANMFCTKMRPATKDTKNPFRQKPGPKPKKIKEDKVPYNKEKTRLKLVEQEGWEENTKLLPTGWKMRSRPRPTQEGQLYFIFMSPELQVFHSRKAMVQHMEDAGTYSKEDMFKVRQLAKPGPRPMNKPSLTNSEPRPPKPKARHVKYGSLSIKGDGGRPVKYGSLKIPTGGEKFKINEDGEKVKLNGSNGEKITLSSTGEKIKISASSERKIKLSNGVKRGPGRPSKAELEMRERELMRSHENGEVERRLLREETRLQRGSLDQDSNTSNSGFRVNYKEDSDSWSDGDEGGSKLRVKRRKKKLQRKKRKTA